MKKIQSIVFILTLTMASQALGSGPMGFVQGTLCSLQNNGPAPGLLVSLVHQYLGRSSPTYTDQYGNFQLFNIPARPEPYLIEVYWGQQLVYRNQIYVHGGVNLGRFCI